MGCLGNNLTFWEVISEEGESHGIMDQQFQTRLSKKNNFKHVQ